MEAPEIREYCLGKRGVTEGFPFDAETLVFIVGGKMFLLMSLENNPVTFNAKNLPEKNVELREKFTQISPGYHMNKQHWNTVLCEGLKPEFLKKLIDESYDLILASLSKKVREEVIKM